MSYLQKPKQKNQKINEKKIKTTKQKISFVNRSTLQKNKKKKNCHFCVEQNTGTEQCSLYNIIIIRNKYCSIIHILDANIVSSVFHFCVFADLI